MSSYYYDRQGNPISHVDWMDMFEASGRHGTRHVAKTVVGDVLVSTVWLGLDHSFGQGPPLIYETMIFDGFHDQYQERYATEAAALAGHDRAVALVRDDSGTGAGS